MKSSFKAKVKCAQLDLKYIGTRRGFETAIESIGLLARWKGWLQRRQHSVHPISGKERRSHSGGSRRVFEQFAWLEVGSGKVALSRPTHQRVTHTVGRQKRKLVSFVLQDISWLTIQCFTDRLQS
jgi:hypothetical protein